MHVIVANRNVINEGCLLISDLASLKKCWCTKLRPFQEDLHLSHSLFATRVHRVKVYVNRLLMAVDHDDALKSKGDSCCSRNTPSPSLLFMLFQDCRSASSLLRLQASWAGGYVFARALRATEMGWMVRSLLQPRSSPPLAWFCLRIEHSMRGVVINTEFLGDMTATAKTRRESTI